MTYLDRFYLKTNFSLNKRIVGYFIVMTGMPQQINSSSSKFQRGWLFKITSKEQLTMTKFQLQSSLLRLTRPQLLQLKIS